MKLDNKGFGLREYIIWISVILVFLLIAVFFIIRLYSTFPDTNNSFTNSGTNTKKYDKEYYEELEIRVKNAGIDYVTYKFSDGLNGSTLTIETEKLIENGYLNNFKDEKGKDTCKGYVVVSMDSENEIDSVPYISCSNYKTTGYYER